MHIEGQIKLPESPLAGVPENASKPWHRKDRLGKSKLISEFLAGRTFSATMKREHGVIFHGGSITTLLVGSALA
jgi:hypothetical protein